MPQRHRDLFGEIASFPALLAAARRAAAGKRATRSAAAFLANLETEVLLLERAPCDGSWRPGEYTVIRIDDPKPRRISAAPFRDRVVHHALCAVIEPIFERGFVFDSYASRVGKGAHRAVARYERFRDRHAHVLRCDVFRYFPAIDHAVLKQDLRRRIACAKTLWLCDAIIDGSNPQEPVYRHFPGDDLLTPLERRRGLPIGNLTSQFFANLYCDALDHFVKEVLRAPGYVRYVDDFALFHDDPVRLHEWRARVAAFLARRRLCLHPVKTHVATTHEPSEFLGYVLMANGRRRLPDSHVRRFRNRLRGLCDRLRVGTLGQDEFRARVSAWIAHASHADTWRLRQAIFPEGPFVPSGRPERVRKPARGARRLLEQQPKEPPRGQPQQEQPRQPQQQRRIPAHQCACQPEPARSWPRRECERASRPVHDEQRSAPVLADRSATGAESPSLPPAGRS